MDIWKQKLVFRNHSLTKFKQLIKKRNHKYLNQAMNTWRSYSNIIEHACRVRILQIEYTQKVYLSQVFNQMRWILRNEKRKR